MIAAPRYQHFSSGGLAMAVHALFLAALMLSMSWKNLPHLPVEAELWAALPEPLQPEPEPAPPPAHEPAPLLPPPVAAPVPKDADIALRKAEMEKQEQKRLEQKRQAEAELRAQEEARKQEELRQAEEKARLEREEQAERTRIEQLKQELKRKQMEQEMARQAQAELENEAAQILAQQEQALRRDRLVDDFKRRIQSKVQSYVRVPQNISGNPEAVFQVSLFANGEVRNTVLVKSSGQPAYDVEVERAILKASPLPLPNEKEAAAVFRGGLVLKFRPQ